METKLSEIANPLTEGKCDVVVDLEAIRAPTVFSARRKHVRLCKSLLEGESAKEAISGLTKTVDVFGFSKGQFSLIDIITACLERTGPAALVLSTWTAKHADLTQMMGFLKSGLVTDAKFILDFSFQRRAPAVAQAIRDTFGIESLRITRNHAKFFLLGNAEWSLTCKTSMNLNTNPRLEDFDISNDRNLFDFLSCIVADIFSLHSGKRQANMNTSELFQQWQHEK